jgi:hypothetical protein
LEKLRSGPGLVDEEQIDLDEQAEVPFDQPEDVEPWPTTMRTKAKDEASSLLGRAETSRNHRLRRQPRAGMHRVGAPRVEA